MLERIKAPQKLEYMKSSSFLKNLCVSVSMSVLSLLAVESKAQEIPEDWRGLEEFFAHYPCQWSQAIQLNNPIDNMVDADSIANGRGFSGATLCQGDNTLLEGPHFPSFDESCSLDNTMSGDIDGYPITDESFAFAPSVGPEGYWIGRVRQGLDTYVKNFDGDLVKLIDTWQCSASGYLDQPARDCLFVQGNEFIYDAYSDSLLIVGGSPGAGGKMYQVEWSKVQGVYNSVHGEQELEENVELVGIAREEILEAAMITPHHIIYLDRNLNPGMFNRTTNGWEADSTPMGWDMYQMLSDGKLLYWDQNFQGVMDVINNDNQTFIRLSCGEITPLYDGVVSFEEAHGHDLPQCPPQQERNESFDCELVCPENQAANADGVCDDICQDPRACNIGEVEDCVLPGVNEDCNGECEEEFERVDGECMEICEFPEIRNDNGFCMETCQEPMACNIGSFDGCEFPSAGANCEGECLDNHEMVSGVCLEICEEGFERFLNLCLPACVDNQVRNDLGECQDLCVNAMACNNGEIGECIMHDPNENCEGECLEGFERVGEDCLAVCGEFQARDENFECQDLCVNAMACNNGEIGECVLPAENTNCDDECLEGFELVDMNCVEVCDDNQMRYGDGECRDINIGGMDMGGIEAGSEGGFDAGVEAGSEGGFDAGVEAGTQMAGAEMGGSEAGMMEEIDMGSVDVNVAGEMANLDMTMTAGSEAMVDQSSVRVDANTFVPGGSESGSDSGIDADAQAGSDVPQKKSKSGGGCQSTPNSNSGWLGLGLMALARVWRRRKTLS